MYANQTFLNSIFPSAFSNTIPFPKSSKYCFCSIKDYLIEIFLKKIFKFTFIILYIYSIVFLWSKGYFIKENYSDILLSCVTYYDNKYEEEGKADGTESSEDNKRYSGVEHLDYASSSSIYG